MSRHQKASYALIPKIIQGNEGAGIILHGSTARGQAQINSDIDIFVVLPCDIQPHMNEYITVDNRSNQRPMPSIDGITVDLGWETDDRLLSEIERSGAIGWYLITDGIILHDPIGVACHCQQSVNSWFTHNPVIAEAWEEQVREIQYCKVNNDHIPSHPSFSDFYWHLYNIIKAKHVISSKYDEDATREISPTPIAQFYIGKPPRRYTPVSDELWLPDIIDRCRQIWDARAVQLMTADCNDGYPESSYSGRYDDIRRKLTPGRNLNLLDIGCGRGSVLRNLYNDFHKVVGIDVSAINIEKLKEDTVNIEAYQASAHDLPFSANSFDRILMYGVLHYMPTWKHAAQVIEELVRVCRSGGIILIGDNEPVVNNAYDPPILKKPQNPSLSRYGEVELCFTEEFFKDLYNASHNISITDTFGQPGHFDVIIEVN